MAKVESNSWFEVREVSAERGGVTVLKSVSLGVDRGELVAIIGANGAGKTTTLRVISSLTHATSGEIRLEGERLDQFPHHEIVRRGIVHVPEGRRLFPDLTTRENVLMGAYLRKDRRKIVSDLRLLEERFPLLRATARQTARSLSGGEQQVVAICRGLMAKPRLLLLDEPSIGLAPLVVKEMTTMVVEITREYGIGVILVEQNAQFALEVAERTYVMELGEIIADGASEALMQDERVRAAYVSR